jgi:hypothetical protein
MSARRIVIARTSFASTEAGRLAGTHPAVVQTGLGAGVIRQGTRLFSDDSIVLEHPELFVDTSTVPDTSAPEAVSQTDHFAGWPVEARGRTREEIWAKYDELERDADERPTRLAVAAALHTTEPTLKRAQKDLGIAGWPPPHRPS